MRQQDKKDSAIVRLALLLAIGTMPMTATLVVPTPILAQSATDAPAFPLPQTLENGTTVRIDGSSSLSAINQNLKQSFEKQFSGTKVEVAANGTDAALKALLEGKVDLAALGRGLTPQEQAQGLEQVRLHREKIAIIVGADNPFKGSLTSRQFARIFRGQITDWSQVGGTKGKIRVIDRPTTSETRETFRNYPVFKAANFATGENATQIAEDNTAEIAKQLGKDGISYALANQVTQLPEVRVLQIHQTSPTDPKYPFSQPLVYVYKKTPNTATAGFLGFAIAPPGKQAIEAARTAEAAAFATGGLQTFIATTVATTSPTTEATTAATASPTTEAINTTDPSATSAPAAQVGTSAENNNASVKKDTPFLLLLPLLAIALLGGLSYWWFRRRRPSPDETADQEPQSTPSPEEPLSPNPNTDPAPGVTNAALAADLSSDDLRNNSESAWDTEAPAAVVNTSYSHLPDVSTVASKELPISEVSSATSNFNIENGAAQPQAESNIDENLRTAGEALAAGAAAWSVVGGTEGDTKDGNTTIQDSNYTVWDAPASGEVLSEIEQPRIENTDAIPDWPNILEPTSDVEISTIEITPALSDLPDVSEPTSDVELPIIETAATFPDLPDVSEPTSDVELPIIETAATFPDLPDVPELDLNAVADEAESTADVTEEDIIEIVSNLPEQRNEGADSLPADDSLTNLGALAGGAVAAGVGIGAWAKIYGSQESAESNTPTPTTDHNAPVVEENNVEDKISLTPVNSESAHVSWQISDGTQQILQNSGSQLALRLCDVTFIDLSYQTPQLIQQYDCEAATDQTVVAIPTSDRNYIAEIGYLTQGEHWVLIKRSDVVRVFSPHIVEAETATNVEDKISLTPINSESAHVSWHISDGTQQILQNSGSQLALRLYDVTFIDLSYQTPQLIQQYDCEAATDQTVVAIPTSDRNYIAEIGYLTQGEHWVLIKRSDVMRVFSPHIVEAETATNVEDKISLTPVNSESAHVSWHISDGTQQILQNSGSQLALRLYDVTFIDLSYQTPQLIQQYDCEAATDQTVVAIPTSDRNYIAEIGYLTQGDRWVLIKRSDVVRIFSPHIVDTATADSADANHESSIILTPRTPKWAYISWYISDHEKQVLHNASISQLVIRLYDVTDIDLSYQTPQLLQHYECEELTHDRFVAIPNSDRDYITEIGYLAEGDRWESIARSTTVRVFSRPHPDFWFVADAELIIHGATEPDATVTIAGHSIKLKPDGTFHLRIPFSDSLMDYLMTANSANGEQTTTIHKKFSQESPEA